MGARFSSITEAVGVADDYAPNFDQAETCIRTVVETHRGIRAKYPLDDPAKFETEVIPLYMRLYEVIGHTTVDTETEKLVLHDPRIQAILPDLRQLFSDCECVFEETWAEKIIVANNQQQAQMALNSHPMLYVYDFLIPMEWNAARTVLQDFPQRIAILGSGALPVTAMRIREAAQKENRLVSFHLVERYQSRVDQSEKVLSALGMSDNITHRKADAADDFDLREFDAVYFAALVGSSREEKEKLLLSVVKRMKNGAVLITRSTHSLKQLAYPAVDPTTFQLKKKLEPVLTVQGHGQAEGTISATVIISRVIG